MRILILNWRDIKNPSAGGAEILTHEMAKQWVSEGHSVIQLSAGFAGAKKTEITDGVRIVRLGLWWNVHVLAFFYYLKSLRKRVDVIIDEVHGLPFFSVLYAPHKTILFACEVAEKLFFHVFPYPVALIGRSLEKVYFKIYKNTSVIAISNSTKQDLIARGFKKKNITVLPMGLTIPKNLKKLPKEKNPTIIYLSRINRQKGAEDAIEAFALIHKTFPRACLWMVGSGSEEYVKRVKNKIRNYGISRFVKFFGYVKDAEKFKLLSRSHILIFPSMHEGWGLVIVEAGIMGTPAAVYNVAGVKDVVKNGERGIIVTKNRPDLLSKAIARVLKNDKLYRRLVKKTKTFEEEIGWEKTSKTALSVLKKNANQKN